MRDVAVIGGLFATLALLAWLGLLAALPENPSALEDARSPPGGGSTWTSTGVSFDLEMCSHCPRYVVAARGLLHGYEMPDAKVWLLLNRPALAAAARPAGRHGTAEIPVGRFLFCILVQWLAVGAVARITLARPGTGQVRVSVLLRALAGWIVVTLLSLLLIFWHLTVLLLVARNGNWRATVGILVGLFIVATLSVLGAVAAYGLWTFREGGRRAGLWFLGPLLAFGLCAALMWGPVFAALPVLFYGAPLALLLTPQARLRCAGARSGTS